MSPLLTSQGMVLATAMAVSGTVILFLCKQRYVSAPRLLMPPNSTPPCANLRSCISSRDQKGEKKKKKNKKKVHFADPVVRHHPIADSSDDEQVQGEDCSTLDVGSQPAWGAHGRHNFPRIPANRMALYSGILQDRLQRMGCSY